MSRSNSAIVSSGPRIWDGCMTIRARPSICPQSSPDPRGQCPPGRLENLPWDAGLWLHSPNQGRGRARDQRGSHGRSRAEHRDPAAVASQAPDQRHRDGLGFEVCRVPTRGGDHDLPQEIRPSTSVGDGRTGLRLPPRRCSLEVGGLDTTARARATRRQPTATGVPDRCGRRAWV
jgi:hypothetical protein